MPTEFCPRLIWVCGFYSATTASKEYWGIPQSYPWTLPTSTASGYRPASRSVLLQRKILHSESGQPSMDFCWISVSRGGEGPDWRRPELAEFLFDLDNLSWWIRWRSQVPRSPSCRHSTASCTPPSSMNLGILSGTAKSHMITEREALWMGLRSQCAAEAKRGITPTVSSVALIVSEFCIIFSVFQVMLLRRSMIASIANVDVLPFHTDIICGISTESPGVDGKYFWIPAKMQSMASFGARPPSIVISDGIILVMGNSSSIRT